MNTTTINPTLNRTINSISGRLSLRSPQRESLEALAKAIATTDDRMIDPKHDVPALLYTLRAEFTTLEDFERDFPSLCFALATGVGKTRLMGAFISYLHLAYGIKNFFVLAPNLTIYEKLIADFTPGTPKYVFKGISEFALEPPVVITGDNYEQRGAQLQNDLLGDQQSVTVNVFNISKINSEVRGGKASRIKRLSEYLGDSYFSYLSSLPDLVLLMDESHRYRASAGVKAINELNPIFGLELTATPFVEGKGKCPPATQDLELNTKNRDATLKNFNYGPLNVDEPGDYWEKIADYWKTDVEAALASNCGNCVAFDISPRMDDCMPGETSDEDGRLGYCWMHHFKCHSARSCHTWAKGGPIVDDEKSLDWQKRGEDKVKENFADGKKKGKSRPGRVKKSGASCNGSVTALRKKAKKASGERARMYHWCANMKGGKKK